MRKFKQKHYECALASMCMATGKSYPLHSRKFHKTNGFMFGDAPNRQEWLRVAEAYLQELNHGVKPDWFYGRPIDFPPIDQRISLVGQGVLSVIRGCNRHTMAFCNKKVYDPQESYIVSWREWKKRNPRWKVYNVTRMETTKNIYLR